MTKEPMLNVGCGSDIRPQWVNADARDVTGADEVFDATREWPFDDGRFETVLASHVVEHLPDPDGFLAEAGRVLKPGGELVLLLPVAMNHRGDDTHVSEWTWLTPRNKLRDDWHADLPFELESRDVDLHPRAPGALRPLQRRKFDWLMDKLGPGQWCWDPPGPRFGPYGGEFEVVLRRDG